MFRQKSGIIPRLIQHGDKVCRVKDVLDFRRTEQVLDILCDAAGDSAPFTKSFPDLYAVGRRNRTAQKQMKLVDIHPCPSSPRRFCVTRFQIAS